MSQTAIPLEFERYLQNQISVGDAPDMNEMIFAHIPGLDPSQPINRENGLPDVSLWVHQQDIDQVGKLGDNALAYSVVIPGTVAEFTFNAIYLCDKNVPNSCGMVVHKAEETKESGMASTKSLVQAYDGAAQIAGITVDASTWQIDYQARLKGIEEDHRLACLDNYGHTAFVDGFDVAQQADPNKYKVTPGVVYVGGLRGVLTGEVLQTIATKPNGLYVDVVRQGTALSVWENKVTIAVSETELTDYVDGNGDQHYVAKLAGINADGSVVDLRVKGGLAEHLADNDPHPQYLKTEVLVGMVIPDSTVLPTRKLAFIADGSSYLVADYPKLISKVHGTAIMVSQALIDANPEVYAAHYGISDDGLTFSVPNYSLRPHLAVAGSFGSLGSTVEDQIQNITGHINAEQEGLMVENHPTVTGAFEITNQFGAPGGGGSGSHTTWKDLNFDASRSARTGSYTEVNSSFLNFYIIHGEVA
jgi:hypothetical protein